MNKVITINLNGTSYQLEEAGYDALHAYLEQASAKLAGNPDKDEIMKDFEQAVAEKCQGYLSTAKNVVTADEVQSIITSMGPVNGEDVEAGTSEQTESSPPKSTAPRRLYRIRDGAMFLGVCNGLSVYFNVDVTLVRLLFVLGTILTSGFGIGVYFVMVLIFPHVETIEEAGVNSSMPFTAHEFIAEAQKNYGEFRNSKEWQQWRRDLKMNSRHWKQQWRNHVKYGTPMPGAVNPPHPYDMHQRPSFLFPVINLLKLLLLILFLVAIATLVVHGTIFGYALPATIPLWAALILVVIAYNLLKWPLRVMKYDTYYGSSINPTSPYYHHDSPIGAVIGPLFFILVCWLAYLYIPGAHDVFTSLGNSFNHFIDTIRAHTNQ